MLRYWRATAQESKLERERPRSLATVIGREQRIDWLAEWQKPTTRTKRAKRSKGVNALVPKEKGTRGHVRDENGNLCTSVLSRPPEKLGYQYTQSGELKGPNAKPTKEIVDLAMRNPHVSIGADGSRGMASKRANAGWGFLAVLRAPGEEHLLHAEVGPVVTNPRTPLYLGGDGGSSNVA